MFEKIKYKGIVYDITAAGLVSEIKRQKENFKLSQPPENQVEDCVEWLDRFAYSRNSLNYKISSYGLKHVVEKWKGDYVCNGAFILAAYRLGYKIFPIEPMSVNARFCMGFIRDALKQD